MAIKLPTWGHRIELRKNAPHRLLRAWKGRFQPVTEGQAVFFCCGPNPSSCVLFLQPGTAGRRGRRFGMGTGTAKCYQEDPGGRGWKDAVQNGMKKPPSALEVLHSENSFVFHQQCTTACFKFLFCGCKRPGCPPTHTQPQLPDVGMAPFPGCGLWSPPQEQVTW